MRICICFFGYSRTILAIADRYIKFLPDADIFIQTYNTFYAEPHKDKISTAQKTEYVTRDKLEKIFKPDKIKYFANPEFNDQYYRKLVKDYDMPEITKINQNSYRILACMDNIRKVIEAKEKYEKNNNFVYDCVILTRLDLRFDTMLKIPSNLNKVTYPVGEGYKDGKRKFGIARVWGTEKNLNDQIMIGNSKIMNLYKDIFNNIPIYFKEGIFINNETIIGTHLIKNNIEFSAEDIVSYEICR
jgi:hypothetical protein